MHLTWSPLPVPAGATPEEAFAAGAVHSHDSKIILLAWVKGVGWCGRRGYEGIQQQVAKTHAQILLRVDDCKIYAVESNPSLGPIVTGVNHANP